MCCRVRVRTIIHRDHLISRDLIHWQRLPPPIQPLTTKTWDGSISMLPPEDGGPLIIYDAQDGKQLSSGLGDSPILGVARLSDPKDKYMLKWVRDSRNPVEFLPTKENSTYFPSTVWKNGNHWNFVAQGKRYQSNDSSMHYWESKGDFTGGLREHGGQWWLPVPNAMDGTPPPSVPNRIVNIAGGEQWLFGTYFPSNETFVHYRPHGKTPGAEAHLEGGGARWFGTQVANNRTLMIGWAQPDYGGLPNPHCKNCPMPVPAGPGIELLTRLSLLREIHYEPKTQNLLTNPVPELKGLRTKLLANAVGIDLTPHSPYVVDGTEHGKASSADVVLSFSGYAASASPAMFGACVLSNSAFGGLGITISIEPSSSSTVNASRFAHVSVGACGANTSSSSRGSAGSAGGGGGGGVQAQDDNDDQPFVPPGPVPLFDETTISVRITPDRSLADFFVRTPLSHSAALPRLHRERAASFYTVQKEAVNQSNWL